MESSENDKVWSMVIVRKLIKMTKEKSKESKEND